MERLNMEKDKNIRIVTTGGDKLEILNQLAKTARLNAKATLQNNETINGIVEELNRVDTQVIIKDVNLYANAEGTPGIEIKTNTWPSEKIVYPFPEIEEDEFEEDDEFDDEVKRGDIFVSALPQIKERYELVSDKKRPKKHHFKRR